MTAEVRNIRTAAETSLAQAYAGAKAALPGPVAMRETAFRRFESAGLPHRRVEAWKYTDLRAAMRVAHPLAGAPDAAAKLRAATAGEIAGLRDARRIVFVDGAFVPDLSDLTDEAGLSIRSMAQALASSDTSVAEHVGRIVETDDVAVALNTALMGDGAVIEVAANATIDRPIHLVFASSGARPVSVFARSLVMIGQHARVTIVETHEGSAQDQVNVAMDMLVGDDAQVDAVTVNAGRPGALHVASLMARIGARVRFNHFTFVTGGAVTRNQLFTRFCGTGTVAKLGGASLLKAREHADVTLVADHVAPGCQSRELYKSVLDGESRNVFQGRIIVQPEAQKTDGKMMAQALLLSEDAEADAKPELEIFADDVQCGHGATVGALDEDLLFYLKARGIPQREAEALMVEAFIGEAVEAIENAPVRDALLAASSAWLKSRT